MPEWIPSGVVWGLAIVRQWRYVLDTASTDDMLALMKASDAVHLRRQGRWFLEHEVLAAATVLDNDSPATICPEAWPPRFAGEKLMDAMRASGKRLRCTRGPACPRPLNVPELLAHWASTLQASLACTVSWQVATPLAMAMSQGVWDGDVSVHFRRVLFGEVCMAPTHPSAGMLRHFASMEAPVGYPNAPPGQPGPEQLPIQRAPHGFLKVRYTGQHLVACVEAASELRSRKKARKSMLTALRWWFPGTWQEKLSSREASSRRMVSPQILDRAFVRMDVASMLARRQWYRQSAGVYRHISFDASPQHGQEFFATVERTMLRSEVASLANDTSRPAVETRIMPLVTLGKGRMGLAEKTQAYVHQTWLEYGPTAASVRSANEDVRVVLADMGTELGIADVRDVVEHCVPAMDEPQRHGPPGPPGQPAFEGATRQLFPRAMVVPGPQHIIDGVVSSGVGTLPYWADWQTAAKVLCRPQTLAEGQGAPRGRGAAACEVCQSGQGM